MPARRRPPATSTLRNCIRRARTCRSLVESASGIGPAIRSSMPLELHRLHDGPARCKIPPSNGRSRWGGRAGWDGVIWRARHTWNSCRAWCSCARKTRWSRRCCAAGGRSRPPAGCSRPRSNLGSGWCAGSFVFTGEYPWQWGPGHVEEWTLSLTAEQHLAPSTIRGYQTDLRLFSEYLTDGRYGWAVACQEAFGPGAHPVAICHEWNTIAHLNDYEGDPEARPFTRQELQRFLDYADDQVERAVKAKRKGALAAI